MLLLLTQNNYFWLLGARDKQARREAYTMVQVSPL